MATDCYSVRDSKGWEGGGGMRAGGIRDLELHAVSKADSPYSTPEGCRCSKNGAWHLQSC